jgi:hypothetical protein
MTSGKVDGGAGPSSSMRAFISQTNAPLAADAMLRAAQKDGAAREHLAHQLEQHIASGTLDPAFGVVFERVGEPALLGGRFDALSKAVTKLDAAVRLHDECKSEAYQMGRNGRLSVEVEQHVDAVFGEAVDDVKAQLAPLRADAAAGKLTDAEKTFVDATVYIVEHKMRNGPPQFGWGLAGKPS